MTNADKYLKDGIDMSELASELTIETYNAPVESNLEDIIVSFFNKRLTPTLTEDERVILRNLKKKYKYIGKDGATLYVTELPLKNSYETEENFYLFNHLFQFIKERRRIFNTRIIRR